MDTQHSPSPCFRLAIADALPLMRAGLCAALGSWPGVQVSAQFGEAAQLLEAGALPDLDLLVLDPDGFRIPPLLLLREIRGRAPRLPLLVFTSRRSETAVRELFRTAVQGYLTKAASPESLRQAVGALLEGRNYLDPEVASIILGALPRKVERRARPRILTARERTILTLLGEGLSNREIAQRLCIGEATVKSHLHSLFRKLPARNRTDAVRQALDLGLVGT